MRCGFILLAFVCTYGILAFALYTFTDDNIGFNAKSVAEILWIIGGVLLAIAVHILIATLKSGVPV